MKRTVIALFSDTHAGSNKALMQPDVVLFKPTLDGRFKPWTPALTPEQVELNALYEENIAQVISFAGGDPIGVLHVGDACQGNAFKEDLVDADVANQIIIAEGNMARWLRYPNVKRMRLVSGTGVHEFGASAATEILANSLAAKYPDKDIARVHHGLIDLDGVSIDYSHHGPTKGKRQWMEGNNAAWTLKSLMAAEVFEGNVPPRVVVRADKHNYAQVSWSYTTGRGILTSTAILLPSYQSPGAYVRKVTQSEYLVDFGMVALEVIDGELGRIKPLIRRYDLRTKEVWV